MYQELIKQELVTAQQALADFIADAENINAIESASFFIGAQLRHTNLINKILISR